MSAASPRPPEPPGTASHATSHCDLERWGWTCTLCGTLNGFDDKAERRFQRPDACPELNSSFVDLEIPVDEAEGGGDGVHALPVYVAAVDLACFEEFLELIKSALLAALEVILFIWISTCNSFYSGLPIWAYDIQPRDWVV